MEDVTKSQLEQNILNSINELAIRMNTPNILAPKGCFTSTSQVKNSIVEYESALMPQAPKLVEYNIYLDSLVNAYKAIK